MPNPSRRVIVPLIGIALLAGVSAASASIPQNPPEPAQRPIAGFLPEREEALIVRTQRLLNILGLYRGPIHGLPTRATEDAVRAFQGLAGLPVDGKVGEELAERLETYAPMVALNNQLQRIRQKDRETARLALSLSANFRAAIGSSSVRNTPPVGTWDDCLRAPMARCLLAEAAASARTVARSELRDWAYGEIAASQARAGLLPDAMASLGLIEDPRLIITGLRDVARAAARSGHVQNAFIVAETIPDAFHRAEALISIGSAQAASESDRAAVFARLPPWIEEVGPPEKRLTLLLGAASLGTWSGRRDEAGRFLEWAQDIAATMENGALRTAAIGRLAAALVEADLPARAEQLLAKEAGGANPNPFIAELAVHKASNGDTAGAIASANQVRNERVRASALQEIARAAAATGQLSAARSVFEQAAAAAQAIAHPYARDVAVFQVVLLALDLSTSAGPTWLTEAGAIAGTGGNPQLRAISLWSVAVAARREGRADAAARLAEDAEQAFRLVENEFGRAWVTAEISERHSATGHCNEARKVIDRGLALADQIATKWLRARAIARLAEALNSLTEADNRCWP
jgi:hypothetical protein